LTILPFAMAHLREVRQARPRRSRRSSSQPRIYATTRRGQTLTSPRSPLFVVSSKDRGSSRLNSRLRNLRSMIVRRTTA